MQQDKSKCHWEDPIRFLYFCKASFISEKAHSYYYISWQWCLQQKKKKKVQFVCYMET